MKNNNKKNSLKVVTDFSNEWEKFNHTNFDDTTFQNPGRTYLMEISFKHDFK